MTISLKQAHQMLEDCAAVIVLDNQYAVLYPAVFDLTGEDDNVFLQLNWTNDEGLEFDCKFEEGSNQEIRVGDTIMILTATDGCRTDIQILNVTPINV